jgi:hypothetical protein
LYDLKGKDISDSVTMLSPRARLRDILQNKKTKNQTKQKKDKQNKKDIKKKKLFFEYLS